MTKQDVVKLAERNRSDKEVDFAVIASIHTR